MHNGKGKLTKPPMIPKIPQISIPSHPYSLPASQEKAPTGSTSQPTEGQYCFEEYHPPFASQSLADNSFTEENDDHSLMPMSVDGLCDNNVSTSHQLYSISYIFYDTFLGELLKLVTEYIVIS